MNSCFIQRSSPKYLPRKCTRLFFSFYFNSHISHLYLLQKRSVRLYRLEKFLLVIVWKWSFFWIVRSQKSVIVSFRSGQISLDSFSALLFIRPSCRQNSKDLKIRAPKLIMYEGASSEYSFRIGKHFWDSRVLVWDFTQHTHNFKSRPVSIVIFKYY